MTTARLDALENADLEAASLLTAVSGWSRATLYAWPERELDSTLEARLESLLVKRQEGVPLAYLLGSREFWSLSLEVTPDVLIPRPDTEILVERALAHLSHRASGEVAGDWIVDAGTGSGAIAIALAKETAQPVLATERSATALAVASRNARQHLRPGRIAFMQGDWLDAVRHHGISLLVSNPPYLADDDPHLPSLAAEPRAALVSGDDGLHAIRALINQARRVCRPGAAVLIEHGAMQAEAVRNLFDQANYTAIRTTKDLACNDRVTEGLVHCSG